MKTQKKSFLNKFKTQQNMRNDHDINFIVQRTKAAVRSYNPRHYSNLAAGAMFLDLTHCEDYCSAMQKVSIVKSHFEGLPALVRERFDNDVTKFGQFMSDKRNLDEAVKLGLVSKKPEKADSANTSEKNLSTSKEGDSVNA